MAFPCGSRSTTSTLKSASASAAPRFTVVVVLPTPPFWFATAMTRGSGRPETRLTPAWLGRIWQAGAWPEVSDPAEGSPVGRVSVGPELPSGAGGGVADPGPGSTGRSLVEGSTAPVGSADSMTERSTLVTGPAGS